MSNKEQIIKLLDNVPDYKMGYVLAYLQGLTADEEADNIFCMKMMEDYNNDTSADKTDGTSIEDFAKELGVNLE